MEDLIKITAWDGSSAETTLENALSTARYLWDEAVCKPGRGGVSFYVDGDLVRTVTNRRDLEDYNG